MSDYVIVMAPDTRDRVGFVLIIVFALFVTVDVRALLFLS